MIYFFLSLSFAEKLVGHTHTHTFAFKQSKIKHNKLSHNIEFGVRQKERQKLSKLSIIIGKLLRRKKNKRNILSSIKNELEPKNDEKIHKIHNYFLVQKSIKLTFDCFKTYNCVAHTSLINRNKFVFVSFSFVWWGIMNKIRLERLFARCKLILWLLWYIEICHSVPCVWFWNSGCSNIPHKLSERRLIGTVRYRHNYAHVLFYFFCFIGRQSGKAMLYSRTHKQHVMCMAMHFQLWCHELQLTVVDIAFVYSTFCSIRVCARSIVRKGVRRHPMNFVLVWWFSWKYGKGECVQAPHGTGKDVDCKHMRIRIGIFSPPLMIIERSLSLSIVWYHLMICSTGIWWLWGALELEWWRKITNNNGMN